MLSPSEFNNAVPKFTNGNYANNPVDPQYIEEPTLQDYNRGVEPLETLPAQWWNWLCNQFTSRFNKINTYVKNIFDEITQLLSLLNISPDGTESAITTGQLKNFFKELYPTYVSDKLELGTTYVPQTRTVNGHALTENVTVTKSDVGLGSVANTGDSANVSNGGTTKFTTGGAYNILTSIAPLFSSSTAYSVGALVTYQNKFYECTTAHSAGAWNSSHFTERSVAYIFTNYILPSFAPTFSTATAYVIGDFVTYQNKLYVCISNHSAGAWNANRFSLANLNAFPYTNRRTVLINQDLNNIKDNGIYRADGADSVTNKPESNLYNWILFVIKQKNESVITNDRLVQIMIVLNNREIYYRAYFGTSDTWSEWIKCLSNLDLAPVFSASTSYNVGDYVTYNGNMYRCTVAHSAGAWNANDFTQVKVGGELTNKADISDLAVPTDAVLHYSFDDLPDYPDGTADVRLLDNNTYQIQSTNYKFNNNIGATFSNNNGKLEIVTESTSPTNGAYILNTFTAGKLVKIKLRVLSITNNGTIGIYNGTGSQVLNIKTVGTYETSFVNTNDSTYKSIYLFTTSGSTSDVIIEAIYIGDGSYSTPVIDNANGKWNSVSQSGVAVQGVSGKAIRFLGNNYIKGNLPWKPHDKKVFTVSGWFKNWDKTTNLHFISDWITTAVANFMIESDPTDTISLAFDVPTDDGCKRFGVNKTILDWNNYSGDVFLTGVFNGDNSKIYVNGINFPLTLRSTVSLSDTIKSRDVFEIGRLYGSEGSSNCSIVTIDDLLIFDRALTEIEVKALYYNKANTPKYYDLDDYKIDNANVAEKGGTGKYIESIKQEGGLIVPVEQTIDTVPSSASTKPITSGAMYNFLGGNTDAKSWLSKAFGWAMGRYWNTCLMGGGSLLVSLNRTVYAIYYANNLWVAGSDKGIIWSEDGEIWGLANGTASYTFKHIYYANGMWVACSTGQSLWWSTDGKTWTKGDGVNTNYSFNHVYYAKKIWVACSESHGMYWSSNGKTWTQGTGSNTSYTFNDVYYGNNIWVACSVSHGLWWSSDGKAWTQGTGSNTNYTFKSVRYADYIWVAGSDLHGLWWSSDGKAWNSSYISSSTVTINYIYYANGMWQACGEDRMLYSSDGKNFNPEYNPFLANCRSVYYANGTWVAGTDKGLIWSINGKNWQLGRGDERGNYSRCQFLCVYFAKNYWLAGGIYDGAHFVQGFWYSDFDLVELKD